MGLRRMVRALDSEWLNDEFESTLGILFKLVATTLRGLVVFILNRQCTFFTLIMTTMLGMCSMR